jgi:hypothetical protein
MDSALDAQNPGAPERVGRDFERERETYIATAVGKKESWEQVKGKRWLLKS